MSLRKTPPRHQKPRRISSFRPQLEQLESRLTPASTMLPTAALDHALMGFDAGSGTLTLSAAPQGASVHVAATAQGIALTLDGQVFSSNAADPFFNPALAGASAGTLHNIILTGGGASDVLTLDDLSGSNIAISSDGAVVTAGDVQVAGQFSVAAASLTVDGTISASSVSLNSAGLLDIEAGGSLLASSNGDAGSIAATADTFVNTGQVRADGSHGGGVAITARAYLNAGTVSASGAGGAGSVQVHYAESYVDTTAATTAADGVGGQVSIDGGTGTRLFSSGRFEATGVNGGAIDLFGQDIFLVGASVDASGTTGTGGKIRVGGDYQGGATGLPNAQTVDVTGSTVLNAAGATAGGRVTVWSESLTDFTGAVSARGETAGGFIEVSSHGKLTYGGAADAGQNGTLLLDPKNLTVSAAPTGLFPQYKLIDPVAGGTFGSQVLELANGNIAVLDPTVNAGRGAVYLFNAQTGALISTLTGSAANDSIGTLTALTGSSNFLLVSPNWNQSEGAVTWASGTTGVSGVISAATSLVGSSFGDTVGKYVTYLANGNYVVSSPLWNFNRGAVTWGSGTVGVKGVVSATNSLVGNGSNDLVGQGPGGVNGVTVLTNGNFVVDSPNWSGTAGAVTWGSSTNSVALAGIVTSANSIVGSLAGDFVGQGPAGSNGLYALKNGNFVVDSPNWNGKLGAVTWGNGSTGAITGSVSSSNSLIGTLAGDQVGAITDGTTVQAAGGVTVLGNGNYVVDSSNWNAGVGAVTWGNGANGSTTGTISGNGGGANSLIGSTAGDFVGLQGVTKLTNNNYVVSSADWNGGRGAVTFGNGGSGVKGTVSGNGFGGGNSLIGSTAGDHVGGIGVVTGTTIGVNGVTALPNGSYVVVSPDWTGGEGAVTWGSGTLGVKGPVSGTGGNSNSLVGSATTDNVGSMGIVVLGSTSNYVVLSPKWNGGAGAATWGSAAAAGVKGVVSGSGAGSNSLIGSAATDNVGSGGVTVLSDNSYVVISPNWTGTEGAVTYGAGAAGVKGVVSALNSLTGSLAGDSVGGGGVVPLTGNGNYVVLSPTWNGGLGAATWGSAANVVGPVSAANSLVGATIGDRVGALTATSTSSPVIALPHGNYVLVTYAFGGGEGAVTFGSGTNGVSGVVGLVNSLIGSNPDGGTFTTGDHVGFDVTANTTAVTILTGPTDPTAGNFVVSSPNWTGGTGAVTWESQTTGVSGVLSASNSLVGSNITDNVGSGGITQLTDANKGNFVVVSPNWNTDEGAVTWGSAAAGVKGAVSSANSLVGSNPGDSVGSSGVTTLPTKGDYVVNSGAWNSFSGAATWANGATGSTLDGVNTIDPQNSLLGAHTGATANATTQAGPSSLASSFMTALPNDNGGVVLLGFTNPALLTYALAQGQTITVTPAFLTQTLNGGTAVILSANDDITIASAITEGGAHGDLKLQAGRSIFINANINTAGGNLTLLANDTKADGVVDSQRDAGAAVIKMAAGVTLNTGTGTLKVDIKNLADKVNSGAGTATLLGLTSSGTTISAATTLGVGINGTLVGDGTAGTYTQTNVVGPIDLSNASLQVTHTGTTAVGNVFTIVTATGTITGKFANLAASGTVVKADDGTPFTITYSTNTITLTQDANTTTVVTSDQNPAPANTPITFTATVQNTSGTGGAPTGSVEFYDVTDPDPMKKVDLGPGTPGTPGASSATWTLTTSTLGLGTHDIQALYTAAGNFLTSMGDLTETIATITTTAVTSNNNPSTFGEQVTFTAAVSSSGGKPAGAVEFFDGTTHIGSGSLVSGGAANVANYTLTTPALAFGGHSIKAVFTSSSTFLGSTSPAIPQTVNRALPTDVLQSDGSLIQYGPGGGFTLLSPAGTIAAVSSVIDGNGLDEVYAITTDRRLWVHGPLGWSLLSTGAFRQISAATNHVGDPVVFGVLTNDSLWENSSEFGGWKQLSPTSIVSISAVTDRSGNDIVYAVTTDSRLWVHNPTTSWALLSTGAFLQVSAGVNTAGQAEVFGVLTDHSLWYLNPANFGWQRLSVAGSILSVSAGAPDEVVAITVDHRLWDHKGDITVGWSLISTGSFSSISATQTPSGSTEIFATLTDSSFWEYDPLFAGTGWMRLLPSGVAASSAPQRVK